MKDIQSLNAAKTLIISCALLLLSAYPNHGDGHRPDDNEERHKCHHQFINCGGKCSNDINKSNYNSCLMNCFKIHKECVEKFED